MNILPVSCFRPDCCLVFVCLSDVEVIRWRPIQSITFLFSSSFSFVIIVITKKSFIRHSWSNQYNLPNHCHHEVCIILYCLCICCPRKWGTSIQYPVSCHQVCIVLYCLCICCPRKWGTSIQYCFSNCIGKETKMEKRNRPMLIFYELLRTITIDIC